MEAILAKLIPPPGSRRLSGAPAGSWREAGGTPGGAGPYYSVTDTSWWRVPGQPKAIAVWEKAHAPGGFTAGQPSLWGPTEVPEATASPDPANVYQGWSTALWLAPVQGVLTRRYLMVEAITNRLGQVYVRIDARVTWNPDRAASERIAATARSVTISAILRSGSPAKAVRPVTIADQGKVASIVILLNGLPVYSGPQCDPVPTDGIRLVFRDASGQLLGTAVAPMLSCTAQLSLAGKAQPALADNPAVVPDLLRIAGIHWFDH